MKSTWLRILGVALLACGGCQMGQSSSQTPPEPPFPPGGTSPQQAHGPTAARIVAVSSSPVAMEHDAPLASSAGLSSVDAPAEESAPLVAVRRPTPASTAATQSPLKALRQQTVAGTR